MAHEGLVDKRAYLNTIGCLIQDSSLIDDIDRPLDRTDFNTENFYELLFVAIYNLHMQGCTTIDEFSIDSYLSNYKEQYSIFQENQGIEYLSNARDMATIENYDYYYHRLRKYALLMSKKVLIQDLFLTVPLQILQRWKRNKLSLTIIPNKTLLKWLKQLLLLIPI